MFRVSQPRGIKKANLGTLLRRSILLLIVFTTLLPLLTGCWDRLELEERALVLGVGIDLATEEEAKKEKEISHLKGSFATPDTPPIKVTVQIAIPGRIPLGPGEGGGSSSTKPVWVLSSIGHTVEDALNNLQQELAERMFYGHLRIVVLSKKYAESGMTDINDYMRRTPDVRRTTWMVVCEDDAAQLMKMAPQLERVPSLYLLATMDQAVRMGKMPNAFVGTFWTAESAWGMDPFLPFVAHVETGNMQLAGLALFRGQKMIGHTEPLEIGGYMAVKGLNPGGYSLMMEVEGTGTEIMYQITRRAAHINVAIRNGKPEFDIIVNNEGNLKEKNTENFNLDAAMITKIENQLSQTGAKSLLKLIQKTQDAGSDIFGFGEYVRARESGYWKRNVQSAEAWGALYKDCSFHVQTHYNIRRIGGKAK